MQSLASACFREPPRIVKWVKACEPGYAHIDLRFPSMQRTQALKLLKRREMTQLAEFHEAGSPPPRSAHAASYLPFGTDVFRGTASITSPQNCPQGWTAERAC